MRSSSELQLPDPISDETELGDPSRPSVKPITHINQITKQIRYSGKCRIVFPYIAQIHQTLHSLPIAAAIAELHPEAEIHIATASGPQLRLIEELARYYPNAPLHYSELKKPFWMRKPGHARGPSPFDKLATLLFNRRWLSSFDAIVVPERTCLYLRHMGVTRPKLIYTGHGAGDRAIGFAHDIKHYDYVLVPGQKIEERLLKSGAITPGRYYRGVYAKFDLMRRMGQSRKRLFANDRPTVIYNPHFSSTLSSWRRFGQHVLEFFARQNRFNLIFAPHYRLFDRQRHLGHEIAARYQTLDHMLIDPGSLRSVDMTYTRSADIYLGDVSSQVAEFVTTPRPCIFLNAHAARWRENPNYQSWCLGDVISSVKALPGALNANLQLSPHFRAEQTRYLAETFDYCDTEATEKAAKAIIEYLTRDA